MHRRILAGLLALSVAASAQTSNVPNAISYQGRITDASGVPVGNTAPVNRIVIFRVWDHPTATGTVNRLYSEQQTVTVSGGEFSVLIGAGTPVSGETGNPFTTFSSAVFAGSVRYLGITVDNGDTNLTNDPESSPRQQIVSAAFALRAQLAEAVATGAITGAAIANSAVDTAQLSDSAVSAAKLASGAVGTAKLADAAVTSAKIGNFAVGTAQLADGAVTAAKLAAGAVDSAKLGDGSVALAKLATDSVDSSKIVNGSIATADLAGSAVDATKLADGAVTLAKHAANSVDSTKLVDGAVTLAKQGANSVDSSKIVDGSIALADLTASVQDILPKPRAIYDQAVNPTVDGTNWKLVPIDLGDLGNDVDGCRLQIIGAHKTTSGSMATFDVHLWVQQAGFTNANSAIFDANRRTVTAKWNNSGSVGSSAFQLPTSTIASVGANFAVTYEGNDWVRFYNYYPGSLRSGDSNRENNASTPQGPANSTTMNIVSIVTGTNKLTITVDNAHAIQVGDSVTLASITGAPSANGTKTVTAQPDRTSFEVALTGASGTYAGGTVTFTPSFHRYRIWAAVHYNVSARFIVSDR